MIRKALATLAAVAILAACTGLELGIEDDFATTRATRATTTAPPANPLRDVDFSCKVLDRDFGSRGSWEVSCKLEFDWLGEPMTGEYFEVCFLDEDGFQVDFGNEIADVNPGQNTVLITAFSKPYHSYELFC